jgi:hypothetical protein
MKLETTTTLEPKRELIELRLLDAWARNPRGEDLGDLDAFTAQIEREAGIREDLHAFTMPTGRLTLMQGHRRRAVGLRLGIEKVWVKVWPFDEGAAFLHLLTMQNGSDPFDARELAAASREAMAMGISKEALVGAMHRSEETVQLYLDLGTMSHRVQDAVHKGKLSLGTAGLMRQLEKEQIELALEGVLYNPLTKEPMSEAQARVYIENAFLKPKKQAKEWAVVSIKLKRKLVADGLDVGLLDVVAWEDRENFVTEGALPMTALARCEEHIEDKLLVNPAVPMTWGELARSHGVPWHLCPAPVIETRHLLLVKRSAVMDADDVAPEGGWTVKGKAWRAAQAGNPAPTPTPTPAPAAAPAASEGGGVGGGGEGGGDEVEAEADEVAAFDEARWRAIAARLMARPEAAMQNGVWESLMKTQWEALAGILPESSYAMMMGEMNRDEVKRKGLRWCLLACVAMAISAADEEALAEVEEALGVERKD